MLCRGVVHLTRCTPVKSWSRNTVIVKRVYKPPLVKVPGFDPLDAPRHVVDKSVVHTEDDKYMVYEIEESFQPPQTVKVILLRNVDDYGVKGQIISFPDLEVHRDLLLLGYAVYHNQQNLEKYSDIIIPEETQMNSSESARLLAMRWSKRVLDICMNVDNSWTIEKWHIKIALRKHRTWTNEENIEIPGGEISGPNLDLENKEFIAILTINNFEKVKIRCRIHHLTTDPSRAIKLESWYFRASEPVWEHERQQLIDMNKQPPSFKLLTTSKLEKDVQIYKQWKLDREKRLGEMDEEKRLGE